MALPKLSLLQLLQVRLRLPANARPCISEPVRTSCWLGCSPTPLIGSPFSVSPFSLLILTFSLCRSSTLVAITAPLAFFQGPLPMRSRAFTVWAGCAALVALERYARQVLLPAPAACASCWQCWSAPCRPPRLPPLPDPTLVMKKVISDCCACTLPPRLIAMTAAEARTVKRIVVFIAVLPWMIWLDGRRRFGAAVRV